tara:strand:- start:3160 stop:4566 length:1407 start_codon:yes stop_codon:yes gene_type:complete
MINFYSSINKDLNQKTTKLIQVLLFSVVNVLIFNLIFSNANTMNSFEDEIISLASHYNFFTSLNFDAEPLIPYNFGVGLTSGPLSAIGGVLGWGLTKNFVVARISNFYYVCLLQIIFSIFIAKEYKLEFKNLVIFSTIQITLVPWWFGSLYSIGEVASTIIFFNSLLLFHKYRNISMFLIGSSIILGKFILIVPFISFYGSYLVISLLKNTKIVIFFKDFFYFLIPFICWYLLIILKTGFDYFMKYIVDFALFIYVYQDSGFESARNISFDLIIQQIRDSEVSDWSTASLIRIFIVPLISCLIIYRNKSEVFEKLGLHVLPIIFSILSTYTWFWILSTTKYIRHTKHFTIIIIFFLFLCLFKNLLKSNLDKLIVVSIISLFFGDLIFIVLVNFLIYFLYFLKLDNRIKNLIMNLLFSSFLLVNLIININETNSKSLVDLDISSCVDGLTSEKCFSEYLYYDIHTGNKK